MRLMIERLVIEGATSKKFLRLTVSPEKIVCCRSIDDVSSVGSKGDAHL